MKEVKQEINVAYILSSTLTNGGATKAFLTMLNGVMEKGVKPLVVVPDTKGVYPTLVAEGIDVAVQNYRPSTYTYSNTVSDKVMFLPKMLMRVILNQITTARLKKLFSKKNIQIVHTNVSIISVGRNAAKKLGIPHIYHFREYGDLDFNFKYFPSFNKFHNSILEQRDYSICITREIQKHHRLSGHSRSRVIYDPVIEDNAIFPTVNKDNYILYAGRIQNTKGLDILLKAYNEALRTYTGEKEFPKLKVAGCFAEHQFVNQIKDYIISNNISSYVELLGECDNIKELMSHSRALIVPSRFEGFGLCMPEAMSLGCLCVGHDNAGTKEQFDNGENIHGMPIGYRFKTHEELTGIILYIIENPDSHFSDIRQRAFSTVNKLYSKKNNSNKVFDFYREIIKK